MLVNPNYCFKSFWPGEDFLLLVIVFILNWNVLTLLTQGITYLTPPPYFISLNCYTLLLASIFSSTFLSICKFLINIFTIFKSINPSLWTLAELSTNVLFTQKLRHMNSKDFVEGEIKMIYQIGSGEKYYNKYCLGRCMYSTIAV